MRVMRATVAATVAGLVLVLPWSGPVALATTPTAAPGSSPAAELETTPAATVAETATPTPSAPPPVALTASPTPSASAVASGTPTPSAAPTVIAPAPASAAPTPSETPTATPAPTAAAEVPGALTSIPSLHITLSPGYTLDDVHADKGFEVPQDPDTEPLNRATLVDPLDPSHDFVDVEVEEIKGRGNFTWSLEKKPYQIKFATKRTVLGMEESKTWILLANHADTALLRNKVAYDLAAQFGLGSSPDSRFVDLFIAGEYLGNYLLSEKVEVKENRVELTHPTGVLVELDAYGQSEDYHFRTSSTQTLFTLKDAAGDIPDLPEPLPAETQAGYDDIRADLDELDALLSATSPDWARISRLIDVPSFIRFYYLHEVTANSDLVFSSVFFHKDGPEDVIHAGPVWDFDIAEGNFRTMSRGGDPTQEWSKNASFLRSGNGWFRALYRIPQFVDASNELYDAELAAHVNALPDTVDAYAAAVAESARENFRRWPILGRPSLLGSSGHVVADTWEGEVAILRTFLATRASMLDDVNNARQPVLRYSAHVAQVGWQKTYSSGQIVGTTGRSRAIEALDLDLIPHGVAGAITANAHIAQVGWTGYGGTDLIGSTGQSRALEALELRLTGDLARSFDIEYRAHVSNIGWQPWVQNGATAGTTGRGLAIEALEIRLATKGQTAPQGSVAYRAHVQNLGWMAPVSDGKTAGTTGRSLRMEALEVDVDGVPGQIVYRAHVSNIGWMPWRTSGSYIGTVGQGLALEALEITLSGEASEYYTVRYRAHVQNIGWQPWSSEGAMAGTTGRGLQVEAVQIELVPTG